jgi:predicted site-specific integrase-resolvase
MNEVTQLDGMGRSEAARELQRSVVWLDQLARDGKIGYVQTPLGRVFRREDVERVKREIAEKEARHYVTAA